jgi:hypothetical protein
MFAVDPLAQQVVAFGGPGIGALWLVLRYKPWKNTNGGGKPDNCPFITGQAGELRLFQLSKMVSESLSPYLKDQKDHFENQSRQLAEQTRILDEIRNVITGRQSLP